MKKLFLSLVASLLLVGNAWGATYYVTEDGAGDNDGSSYANAESLSDFNGGSFGELDGDTAYFCDTIRGTITVPDSGSEGSIATFRGDYPDHAGVIYGSEEKNDSEDWTQETSGTLDGYSETDSGSDAEVDDDAAHGGSYSWEMLLDDATAEYISKDISGTAPTTLHFVVWLKFSTMTPGTDGKFYFSFADNAANAYIAYFHMVNGSSKVQLYSSFDDASDNMDYTDFCNDTDWHKLEVHLKKDSGGNGYHKVYFDDVEKHNSTGLTGTDNGFETVKFGAEAFITAPTTVTIYWDDIVLSEGISDTADFESGTNLWYWATGTEPNVAWGDTGSGFARMTKVEKGSCDADGEWSYDGGNVYVYDDTGEPTRSGARDFEFPQRNNAIAASDKSYVTLNGITTKYCNEAIIDVAYSSSEIVGWTVQNSTISGCWQHGISFQGASGHNSDAITISSNTIDDWGGTAAGGQGASGVWLQYVDEYTINSNTILGNENAPVGYGYHRGIFVQHTAADDKGSSIYKNSLSGTITGANSAGIMLSNIHYADVYNNKITGAIPAAGLWVDESSAGSLDGSFYCNFYNNYISLTGESNRAANFEVTNNDNIYSNVFDNLDNNTAGWGVWFGVTDGDSNTNFYNNTVTTTTDGIVLQVGSSVYDDYCKGITFKNNILYLSGTGGGVLKTDKEDGETENLLVFDNNLYYKVDGVYLTSWFGDTDSSLANFNATYSPQENNGIESDPLFTDAGSDDFTLQPGSPCRIGATLVGTGNIVTNGNAEDDVFSIGDLDSSSNCSAAIDAGQAHGGAKSLKVTKTGVGVDNFYVNYGDATMAGKKYLITAWVYIPSGQSAHYVAMRMEGGDFDSTELTDQWVKLQLIDTNVYGAGTAIDFYSTLDENEFIYIDDFTVEEFLETKLRPESSWPDGVSTMKDILSIGAYGAYRGSSGMK